MARLAPILAALAKLSWRELRRFNSLGSSNFFLFAMLIFGLQPANAFLPLVLGLILLFPLSADPLGRMPADRLRLWPLSGGERIALRAASLLMSPIAWITLGLMGWSLRGHLSSFELGWRFLAFGSVLSLLTYLFTTVPARMPQLNLLRLLRVTHAPLAALMAKNAREMFSLLDTYLALVLTAAAVVYRLLAKDVQPDALFGVSLLIVLALSTMTQALFALDGPAGMARYQLMPLRGWQILLTKDVPLLALAVLSTVFLAPLAAFSAMLGALAVGHHAAVVNWRQQKRWRFAAGSALETSVIQIVVMFGAGTVVHRVDARLLAVSLASWAASLVWYGYVFERNRD